MADFFGFSQSTDFEHGLHDGPGDGLDEDADDYDALNDETFGADSMGGDWEQGHEEMAEITEKSRVHRDSFAAELENTLDEERSIEDMGLEDLALEASLSQLVDECDDNLITMKTKQKRAGIADRVVETGYSCSPPSEFNVWAVGEHDRVRHVEPISQPLPTLKKVHTLEELERGLRMQSSQLIAQPAPLRLEDLERDLTRLGLTARQPGNHRPLTDMERELARKGTIPFGSGYPRPINQQASGQGVQERNTLNGIHPPDYPHGLHGPPNRNGPLGPILNPNQLQSGPGMMDFRHHPHRPHMGNVLRFMPVHPMMQQFQHQRNNMNFRMPNYPMPGHQMMDPRLRQMFPRMPMPRHPGCYDNGYHRDEYDGLMSNREIQWLLNIQMLQINTGTPYQDDFYFTVFQSRKPQNRAESRNGRSPRDSRPESSLGQQARVYTPLQFENSLGKLQCGSVTAPRKIIDMDIVKESIEPGAQQKDSRKVKRLLLQLEQLYLLLMQVEDQSNPLSAPHDPSVDRVALIERILNTLTSEDRLQAAMCIRKGKGLILRLLPHVSPQNPYLDAVWCSIMRHVALIGRRDLDGILPRFYPYLRRWLHQATEEQLTALVTSLKCPPAVLPARGPLSAAMGLEFGISALSAILTRAATLVTAESQDWRTFVTELLEAATLANSDNHLAAEPIAAGTLSGFIGKFADLKMDGLPRLLAVLSSNKEV